MQILQSLVSDARSVTITLVVMAVGVVIAVLLPTWTLRAIALLCLLGIVLLVLGVQALFAMQRRRRAAAIAAGLDAEYRQALDVSPQEQRARVAEIRKRFNDAVLELRRARKSIYDLPWYLLIGEPQSGKSMTLRGSDLNFPIGADKLSGMGGTRNCDWWFTNQAIILDTAGRFTFQEAGAPDRAEWEGFLDLLAKRRRQCPINGVLVVVPTDALLNDSPEQRKVKAKNMHDKLTELQRKLGVQFPVFVVITKCDLVVGFSEFFRHFGEVEAAQILGWSNDAPVGSPLNVQQVQAGFHGVYERLRNFRLERLRDPVSLEERGLVYSFPEEFRALGEPLQQYLSAMFAEDIFHEPLFFRGFYFTSGMQEGTPIVKVGREILRGGAGAAQGEFDPLGSLFPSRPFFIADLYKEKALRESRMVFRSKAEMRRGRFLKRWTYAGGALLAVLLASALTFGGMRVRKSVSQPLAYAQDAVQIIGEKKPAANDVVDRQLASLDNSANDLAQRGWWFRLTFPFRDPETPVRKLQTVRDALFAQQRLRPVTEAVEAKLADTQSWTPETAPKLADATREYVRWQLDLVPETGKTDARAAALERLAAPVRDSMTEESFDALEKRFARMDTAFEKVRPLAIGPAAAENLAAVLDAAQAYYDREYAQRTGLALGDWNGLVVSAKTAQDRYHALLDMLPRLRAIDTVREYDEAWALWRRNYSGAEVGASLRPGEDPRGFATALDDLRRYHDALSPRGLKLPDRDRIRASWLAFFGEPPAADSLDALPTSRPEGETAAQMVDLVRQAKLTDVQRNDLYDRIRRANRQLDERLTRSIDEIKAENERLQTMYSATGISEPLSATATVLEGLNTAFDPNRPPLAADLTQWAEQVDPGLHPAIRDAVTRVAPRNPRESEGNDPSLVASLLSDAKWTKDEPWRVGDNNLAVLGQAVAQAVRRHAAYFYLTAIKTGDLVLEQRLPNEPSATLDAAVYGFSGLQRWNSRAALDALLDGLVAVDYRITGRGAPQPLRSEAGSGDDLKRDATAALDTAVSAFGKRDFEQWAKVYGSFKLGDYDALIDGAHDWNAYCNELQRGRLVEQAESCLRTLRSAVLELDPPRDAPASPRRSKLLSLLKAQRRSAPVCGPVFESLASALQTQPGQALGTIPQQFVDFEQTVFNVGVSDKWSSRNQKVTLAIDGILDLQRRFPDEHILRQLYNVALQGRFMLDVQLDDELARVVEATLTQPQRTAFPFQAPMPGATPAELSPDDFSRFIRAMRDFEKRFEGAATARDGETTPAAPTPNTSVGRAQFLGGCNNWFKFVYGADELLARNAAQVVTFSVKSIEPRQARRANEKYTTALLTLGGVGGDTGVLIEAGAMSFDLTRQESDPQTRTWQLGRPLAARLDVTEPVTGAALPPTLNVPEATLTSSNWTLPVFVHRFSQGTPAVLRNQATARVGVDWPLLIPVRLDGELLGNILLQIQVGGATAGGNPTPLPELIGVFVPDTKPPTLVPVGERYPSGSTAP